MFCSCLPACRRRRGLIALIACALFLLSFSNIALQTRTLGEGGGATNGRQDGKDWHAREVVMGDADSAPRKRFVDDDEAAGKLAPLDVIVMVLSAPANSDRRKAIRETWMTLADKESVSTVFVMGALGLDEDVLNRLEEEQQQHGDVVIVHGLYDDYTQLTDKILAGFVHVTSTGRRFRFLLKVDDNSWVRTDRIAAVLSEHAAERDSRLHIGFMDGRAPIKAAGKWAEKNWKLCDRYLPYATGGGYVLSSDLVQFLADNRDFLMKFLNEDVSVGAWLAGLDVKRIHDTRFDTQHKSRGCSNDYVVSHPHEIIAMHDFHRLLKETGKQCDSEHLSRPSYKYNWNVPPSQCCVAGTANQ